MFARCEEIFNASIEQKSSWNRYEAKMERFILIQPILFQPALAVDQKPLTRSCEIFVIIDCPTRHGTFNLSGEVFFQ